jgi:hypothetical protein
LITALGDRLRELKPMVLDIEGTIYRGDTLFPYTQPFLDAFERAACDIWPWAVTDSSARPVWRSWSSNAPPRTWSSHSLFSSPPIEVRTGRPP